MNNSSLKNTSEPANDNISAGLSGGRKRIGARAFIGTFGTSIFLQGCMLAQGMIVARLLGPDGRGQFAAIVLWPNILANIGLFGVSFSVARIAAKIKDVGSIARSGLLLSLIMGVITGLVGFCYEFSNITKTTDSDRKVQTVFKGGFRLR